MKHLKLFLALFALIGVNLTANAQTDVTSQYITNASFETDEAASNLTSAQNNPTGWALSSSSGTGNTQWGTANASTTIQGYATSFSPSEGPNYFYLRCNWQSGTTLSLAQTTSELSTGIYLISFDAVTYSSNGTQPTYTFKVGDGTNDLVSGTMTANKTSWSNYSYSFALTSASTVTITAAMKPGAAAGGKHDWMLIDNVKLQYFENEEALDNYYNDNLREQNGLTDASVTNGMLTSFVVNGTFDSNVNGWSRTGGFQNNNTASNQQGDFTGNFYENWNSSAKVNKMYQTINNIPNGTYKLKIAAFVNNLADPNESQFVFANNDKTYLTTGSPTFYEVWTVVTNNTVEIGLEQTTATANWMGIDNVSLTYYGAGDVIDQAQNAGHKADWDAALAAAQAAVANTDYANVTGEELTNLNAEIAKAEPTTAEGYDEATAALVSATNAFIAAKSAYDAFVVEKANAALLGVSAEDPNTAAEATAAVEQMMVEEYEAVIGQYTTSIDLGTWTESGAANFSNEHWSGTTRNYKNQDDSNGKGWNASSWDMSLSQSLSLPAGEYVLKVAGRMSANAFMSLTVKQGEEVIGTVNNFPQKGNKGRGINKEGATSFDASDAVGFANGNEGFGWEWRYVPFTLTEEATVSIAIEAGARQLHEWASFGDYTVQAKPNMDASLAAYNQAVLDAQTAIEENAVVTGEELAALNETLAADKGETIATIDAATEAIKEATAVLVAAKASYDALIVAKAIAAAEEEDYPYASAEKKTAFETALEAANTTVANAEDAVAKASALTTAQRTWVESNAKAEGVTDFEVEDYTNKIENARAQQGDRDAIWPGQAWGWTKNVNRKSDEKPTYADGATLDYLDGGDWNGSSWDIAVTQKISGIPAGKYLLSVTARAENDLTTFELLANDKTAALKHISADVNTGTFGRGYNDGFVVFEVADASEVVTIGVRGVANSAHQWMSFTNFRLVKIAELDPVSITIKAGRQYTAFSSDRALDFTNSDLKAQIVISATGTTRDVTKVPANKGIIVGLAEPATEDTKITVPVCADETDDVTDNMLVAVVDGANIMRSNQDYTNYVFGKKNGKEAFYKIPTEGIDVPANNAYLAVPTASGAKEVIFLGGETTGISNVDADAETGELYNLSGVKVKKAQKGVYIQNGKKVIVK